MEVQYYSDITRVYHTNYVRNSRAIAVLWGIFTICFTLLNIVVFIQPQWFGDTMNSPDIGFFGLYEYCERTAGSTDFQCIGEFTNMESILNASFKAAGFFVGFSALLFIICVLCLLLFFFLNTATVLKICGWIQTLSAVAMLLGCVVYPNGWDNETVRRICGVEATKYYLDRCTIRWAYILAIILIFDAIILAVLAFVLAAKQARVLPEIYHKNPHQQDNISKIMSEHEHDGFSEYSHRSEKSKRSLHSARPDPYHM
ncbi:LHFPL tetraspan subfamily member 3 protein [Octopus bimaculoides]|uniref:LHFPL tetraspan subfamily member 3 protein n=1 Tax=Octopus bimaculoides TaxID=37653 RepID=A0A0L8HSZ6_OCTBM|nr:LHFPL tetraspan subfamily member 3 protein [Octopus bimaculoides]XP_014770038.1 LHFPL tetraspan subfamily member 3 protein [Octopus bimaculoides]XP_052822815.1 LHFPL tetraspan subfamily member 3 protein [Octopus bimaculoides]|eukprot:XP_014770037.1 PREDICTED: lipoma HMGIC fusion partner-like 3 protein [Octopus bimaculoides]